jgi:hypothetical protein
MIERNQLPSAPRSTPRAEGTGEEGEFPWIIKLNQTFFFFDL